MSSIATLKTWDNVFLFPMQQVIKDYLYTDPFFQDFPILTEDMGNLPEELEKALQGILTSPNGKSGVSIMLHTLRGKRDIPNIPASYSLDAEAVFVIAEKPELNRGTIRISGEALPESQFDIPVAGFQGLTVAKPTGIPALVIAETLIAVMKRFKSSEFPTSFREPDKPQMPPIIDKDTGLIIHVVTMLFHGGVVDNTEVVEQPTIAIDPATYTATISCATPGAVIYYTTDGMTRPTNIATQYTSPFDASGGDYVWARAYRTGWRASTIAFADVRPAQLEEAGEDILEETGATLRNE